MSSAKPNPDEVVRYIGEEKADVRSHDGRLRPVGGVQNYQVTRANRTHPEQADGFGWTYNHAPMLAYWRGTFYLQYLSNPKDEHIVPGQTFLVTSTDGIHWGRPQVLFPVYRMPDGTPGMMHQRMGFYVAPDGRLLTLGFYGKMPDPVDGTGLGRVVREIYEDGSFGPIYFLRYNRHRGWNETNTHYPFYTAAPDRGFQEACAALLANRLMTAQWWDEDQSKDGFFSVGGHEALSFYHRQDGKVVGLWKWSHAALSADEGKTWSPVAKVPSLVMDGGKIWGQRTQDGRYALVYNPSPKSEHRWPLGIVTGEDGITFDNLLIVHGEVPPRRFAGRWKDFGPQYTRGIAEGNGAPPGDALWVCYSVNKEDMWVSRIPLPVRGRADDPVEDTFDQVKTGGFPLDWNLYSPLWAPVRVVKLSDSAHKALEMQDRDPHDYAKAVRVFPESKTATIEVRLRARQANHGRLEIEVLDRFGSRPVRLALTEEGKWTAQDGRKTVVLQPYAADAWYDLRLEVNVPESTYTVFINGKAVVSRARFAAKVESIERLSFRTGPYRDMPKITTRNETPEDAPLPDDPVPLAVYHIAAVNIQ